MTWASPPRASIIISHLEPRANPLGRKSSDRKAVRSEMLLIPHSRASVRGAGNLVRRIVADTQRYNRLDSPSLTCIIRVYGNVLNIIRGRVEELMHSLCCPRPRPPLWTPWYRLYVLTGKVERGLVRFQVVKGPGPGQRIVIASLICGCLIDLAHISPGQLNKQYY